VVGHKAIVLLLVLIFTPVASWVIGITMFTIGFIFGLVNWFGVLIVFAASVAYAVKRLIAS
jgi:hypothetical protein